MIRQLILGPYFWVLEGPHTELEPTPFEISRRLPNTWASILRYGKASSFSLDGATSIWSSSVSALGKHYSVFSIEADSILLKNWGLNALDGRSDELLSLLGRDCAADDLWDDGRVVALEDLLGQRQDIYEERAPCVDRVLVNDTDELDWTENHWQ